MAGVVEAIEWSDARRRGSSEVATRADDRWPKPTNCATWFAPAPRLPGFLAKLVRIRQTTLHLPHRRFSRINKSTSSFQFLRSASREQMTGRRHWNMLSSSVSCVKARLCLSQFARYRANETLHIFPTRYLKISRRAPSPPLIKLIRLLQINRSTTSIRAWNPGPSSKYRPESLTLVRARCDTESLSIQLFARLDTDC